MLGLPNLPREYQVKAILKGGPHNGTIRYVNPYVSSILYLNEDRTELIEYKEILLGPTTPKMEGDAKVFELEQKDNVS